MQNNAKRKLASGIVYVFLAFMLVTLLCVGLLTALTGGLNKSKDKTTPDTTVTVPDTQKQASLSDTEDEEVLDASGGIADIASPEPDTPIASIPYAYDMPVNGFISKDFDLEMAVYSMTMDDYRVHSGIDIEAEVGAAVSAFADGTVSTVWRDPFMGYCMCIEHDGGMKSYYMNLSAECAEEVAEGTAVSCGQVIGYVGDSAAIEAAQTPHLHFEVTVNGQKVDPLDYLDYDASLYPSDSSAEG